MKKYLSWIIPIIFVAFLIFGLYSQTRLASHRLYIKYNEKLRDTINTKANRTDTSEWKDLNYSEYADFVMNVFNTDSGAFVISIDGEFGDYQTEIFTDSLKFNTSNTFTDYLPYYTKSLKSPCYDFNSWVATLTLSTMTFTGTDMDTLTGSSTTVTDTTYYNFYSTHTLTGTIAPGTNSLTKPAINNFPGLKRVRVRTAIRPYTNNAIDTHAFIRQELIIK